MEEIEIKSVDQYLKCIKKIEGYLSDYQTKVFFRGEADVSWKQKASLFRGENGGVVWDEREMIQSAVMYYPNAFDSCSNAIGRLVKMQHYGLPTRLYDVTANPLIALYFACSIESDKDGVVYYTAKNVQLTNLLDVNVLADLSELLYYSQKSIKGLYDYLRVYNRLPYESSEESMEKFLFDSVSKSFLFQPPWDNERIKRQQGAMIFSALMEPFDVQEYKRTKRSKNIHKIENLCFSKCKNVELNLMFAKQRYRIKSENKKNILLELDKIGINEGFVYPELDKQMKTIKYRYLPQTPSKLDI